MKINVTKSSMPSYEEYCQEIKELWDTRWLTNMGAKHNLFKDELKGYLDAEYVDLTTNGHLALEVAIQALDLRGEVITTPFTFASTTHAIVRCGLTPVFCDIDPQTYTIDTNKIEELITDRTSAIIPVHVYGNVCNVEEIDRIAKKYGLKVIYDAAHTFGVKYKGKGLAAYGDAVCYSFHATKVFHTIEGGAICTADDNISKAISKIKDFGITDEENVDYVGPNAKMNEFCAAMGICNLRHIDAEIEKRRVVVERYMRNLEGKRGLHLNHQQDDVVSNYAYYPVLIDENKFGKSRDQVVATLLKHGIGARKYFYPITSEFACYRDKYDSSKTPLAIEISKNILTLPLYSDIAISEVDYICDIMN